MSGSMEDTPAGKAAKALRAQYARGRITLVLVEQVMKKLEELLKTGLYGKTLEQVAEELLLEKLREIEAASRR